MPQRWVQNNSTQVMPVQGRLLIPGEGCLVDDGPLPQQPLLLAPGDRISEQDLPLAVPTRLDRLEDLSAMAAQGRLSPQAVYVVANVRYRAHSATGFFQELAPAETEAARSMVSASMEVSASRAISALDAGRRLHVTGAFTLTIPAGLSPRPSFSVECPASGVVTIAVSGGATINGATSSITRARTSNWGGFVVTALQNSPPDGYGVSGA